MKKHDKDLIVKITKLCVNSACDTFHPFIDFSPHVKSLSVNVHVDGWNGNDAPVTLQAYFPPTGIRSLQKVHDDLVELIKSHEFRYSPEQLKKTEEARKAEKNFCT